MTKQTLNLEYKIGNMDGNPSEESSFIVCLERDKLVLYSSSLRSQKEIAAYYHEGENVLGGGKLQIKDRILKLCADSHDFGFIPSKVATNFVKALKSYAQKMPYNFDEAELTHNFPCHTSEEWGRCIDRWEELGFEVFK